VNGGLLLYPNLGSRFLQKNLDKV